MILDCYSFSFRGGRVYNEDFLGWKESENGGLYVLADGLGGHERGDVASECVVNVLLQEELPQEASEHAQWLEQAIIRSNDELLRQQKEQNLKMKSTVAALLLDGRKVLYANVGDSRVYCFHDGLPSGVTQDHSVAFKKYKAGEIRRHQIGTDPDQSVLLRALGSDRRFQPDVYEAEFDLGAGDAFLLCSDGLWEYIFDEEILVDLLKSDCSKTWGELMLMRVMERVRSGNDNLSLITVMVKA